MPFRVAVFVFWFHCCSISKLLLFILVCWEEINNRTTTKNKAIKQRRHQKLRLHNDYKKAKTITCNFVISYIICNDKIIIETSPIIICCKFFYICVGTNIFKAFYTNLSIINFLGNYLANLYWILNVWCPMRQCLCIASSIQSLTSIIDRQIHDAGTIIILYFF